MTFKRKVLPVLSLACWSTLAVAQNRVDIVQIWQNFIASGVAEHACATPEKPAETKFLANLTDVTIRATQRLQERNPGASQAALAKNMQDMGTSINTAVKAEITANGCTSPKIQQLLKMYTMHSTMNF